MNHEFCAATLECNSGQCEVDDLLLTLFHKCDNALYKLTLTIVWVLFRRHLYIMYVHIFYVKQHGPYNKQQTKQLEEKALECSKLVLNILCTT